MSTTHFLELTRSLQNLIAYDIDNQHPEFSVHQEDGTLKQGITKAFLCTRWIKPADLEIGFLMADVDYYTLLCSKRLIQLLEASESANIKAIRAICSFQTMQDGTRRAVCQMFYKLPYVR